MTNFAPRSPRRQYRLLDVNARTWGYHTLGAGAGVDFAYLLFADQTGQSVQPLPGQGWRQLASADYGRPDRRPGNSLWPRELPALSAIADEPRRRSRLQPSGSPAKLGRASPSPLFDDRARFLNQKGPPTIGRPTVPNSGKRGGNHFFPVDAALPPTSRARMAFSPQGPGWPKRGQARRNGPWGTITHPKRIR